MPLIFNEKSKMTISTLWVVMLLVVACLSLAIDVLSTPVIINEVGEGSWSDSFYDYGGIEEFHNISVSNGNVRFPYVDPFNPTNWTKHGLAVDITEPYETNQINDADVLKDGNTYKMYYEGRSGFIIRILLVTSIDGITWTKSPYNPVIDAGDPGDFDDFYVSTPEVIKDEGIYKMWYTGNDGVMDRIMYATSSDGVNWSKQGVVLTGQDANANTVIKDGAQYKMWYQQYINSVWEIYYANSSDGINWIKKGKVLGLGAPGEPDDAHVSGAAVVKENNNLYRMWYSGHDGDTGYRIYYASSDNEMNWIKKGLALGWGTPGDLDDAGVSYCSVIKDDDGFFKMWYSGNPETGDTRIMYASSPYPFTKGGIKSINISLPSYQKWDKLIINKTELGVGNYVRVAILDSETNGIISGFENLADTHINISSLDIISHQTIKLSADFVGNGSSSPILHDWKITWLNVANRPPIADAGGDLIVHEGDIVRFNGGSSYDPDGIILTYEWDFDARNGLWWKTGAMPEATGPTPTHIYGDNGDFIVTMRVVDDQGASAQDTCNITVLNINPSVSIESVLMNMEIGLRVAGRKYNDVAMTLYEEGNPLGHVSIERVPGSPDAQMAWIPVSLDMTKNYSATVTYIPEGPPDIGSNPVWIYIRFENGSIEKLHHNFNVQQSKKRNSGHWNHVEPWEEELNSHFIGLPFEITAHVTDPGSDDIFLTYTYGSQILNITYLNNPPNPDSYPSPEYQPRDIMDVTAIIYECSGNIILFVEDDDTGGSIGSFKI